METVSSELLEVSPVELEEGTAELEEDGLLEMMNSHENNQNQHIRLLL